jgi:hypothetical protein
MNIFYRPVPLPASTWYIVPFYNSGTTIDGATYNYVITSSGDYFINDLSKPLHVAGNARLLVLSKIALTGATARIGIAPGSSLQLFVYCPSAVIGGAGVVNSTGNALNFSYYGLPSNTNLTYSADAGFTGTIIAPHAAFNLGSTNGNTNHFIGASVTKSLKMVAPYHFHFDENLMRAGPAR